MLKFIIFAHIFPIFSRIKLLRLAHENNYLSYTRNGFLATAAAMGLLSQEELRSGARISASGNGIKTKQN